MFHYMSQNGKNYMGVSSNGDTLKTPQNVSMKTPWLLGTTILGNPYI